MGSELHNSIALLRSACRALSFDTMRLLNVKTRKLEEFFNMPVPEYAILSHTWGEDELVYRDFQESDSMLRLLGEMQSLSPKSTRLRPRLLRGRQSLSPNSTQPSLNSVLSRSRTRNQTPLDLLKPSCNQSSYLKLDGCCVQATKDGHSYVWIDTICIDKSSSAELSEAINSMYKWYADAQDCYVYLSDVELTFNPEDDLDSAAFRKSRWFSRGWTLQELLAPRKVVFFTRSWDPISGFYRNSSGAGPMVSLVTQITGVPGRYLNGGVKISTAPVCQKMAWAARRRTTRPEDEAYCLLGLFGLNMPLLYGEGSKAFMRLQEQIMQVIGDDTLFCWGQDLSVVGRESCGLLANAPSSFAGYEDTLLSPDLVLQRSHYTLTNRGILFTVPSIAYGDNPSSTMMVIPLNAHTAHGKCIALPVSPGRQGVFQRVGLRKPFQLLRSVFDGVEPQALYLRSEISNLKVGRTFLLPLELPKSISRHRIVLTDIYPPYVADDPLPNRDSYAGNRQLLRLSMFSDNNATDLQFLMPLTLVLELCLCTPESTTFMDNLSLLWRITLDRKSTIRYWAFDGSEVCVVSQGLYHGQLQASEFGVEHLRKSVAWRPELYVSSSTSGDSIWPTGDNDISMTKLTTRTTDPPAVTENPYGPIQSVVASLHTEEVRRRLDVNVT